VKTRRILLLWTCAALTSETLPALDPNRTPGQYIVSRWGPDSFPGGAINAIAQTADGCLWIGAEHGLVRFDGIGFRVADHAGERSLPSGPVLGLFADSDGALWVRMQSPYLMRYRGGRFEQMYPEKIPLEFTFAREEGAAAAARGTSAGVLIATPAAPLRYAGGTFRPIISSGSVHGIPTSIAETADGAVWVGMRDSGLFCARNGRGWQAGLPDQKVNALLPAAGPRLWIGTDSGLAQWNGASITRRGVPDTLTRTAVLALARDRDSNLWISTPAGVTRMDSNGAVLRGVGRSSIGTVRAIFEDREGCVWFGGTEGLMQLRDTPFLSHTGVSGEGGSLFVDASGRAWIGPSSGGLLWLRGAERRPVKAAGMDRDVVYSMAGGPGELWIGRRLGGLTQLREEAGAFHARTYTARNGLAPGVVYAVHRSRDGAIWAGTLSGGISRIEKGRITTFTAANGLSGDPITAIEDTADGVIWVGTAGGLQAFRNGKWRRYSGEDGFPPGRVNSLAVDAEGTLWIGSYSGLLWCSGAQFESPRNAPPLLQEEIYGLAADDSDSIWAVTDSRVVRVSRASLRAQGKGPLAVREFSTADGLPSTRGTRRDHAVVKDPTGRIWFSLPGGICVVNPRSSSAPAPALVNVESVTVDGRALGAGSAIRYSSSRQRVVFSFIGVSLAFPGRVRYRYRLDGYDADWSEPTESREASYTRLPPARYTFHVMADNAGGPWNGTPASVSLEVEPQVWETWWFRMTAVCLAGAAILAGVRYRLARAHAAMNLRFEERLAERTRIARELHDTLLQSFQGLMLRLQLVDDLLPPGKAKEQLGQSLERADQAIAEGRSAVYDLRSSTTGTNDLPEAVRALGAELGEQGSTAFHLVVEGSPRVMHPIIRDELYRIAREGLRNAFSHAQAAHIETEMIYGERAFRMRIRDDGQGIPPEVLQAGRRGHYGLSGMRERAQQTGVKLQIWSGARAGTEIDVTVAASIAYPAKTSRLQFAWLRKKAGCP